MLTSLRLVRFKAWRDSGRVRLAPLTVLFGENGTGKSSLSQLLRAMRQTVEAGAPPHDLRLGGEDAPLDLGRFADVAHRHEAGEPIALELELSDEALRPLGGDALTLETRVHAAADSGLARCVGGTLTLRSSGEPARASALPPEPNDETARVLLDALARALRSVIHLGPFRDVPARLVEPRERAREVGSRGEYALAALLAHRDLELELGGERRTLLEHVEERLRRMALAHAIEFSRASDARFEARVRLRPNGAALRFANVGSGLVHALPVVVACLLAPPGSLVIFEQPELHLHPGVQAELGDLFAEAVVGGRLQLLVESHSEPLLQRLQRRVAEGTIAPGAIALHHVRRVGDEARAHPLELDAHGNLLTWPEHLFGDPMADLLARAEITLEGDER